MIFGQLTSDFPPCSFWTTSGGPMGACPGFALRVTEWRCSTAEFSVVCWRDVSLFPFPILLRCERVSIHFLPGFRTISTHATLFLVRFVGCFTQPKTTVVSKMTSVAMGFQERLLHCCFRMPSTAPGVGHGSGKGLCNSCARCRSYSHGPWRFWKCGVDTIVDDLWSKSRKRIRLDTHSFMIFQLVHAVFTICISVYNLSVFMIWDQMIPKLTMLLCYLCWFQGSLGWDTKQKSRFRLYCIDVVGVIFM